MRVFDEYIKPKIIKELAINFTEEELKNKLMEFLTENILLGASEYKVSDKDSYKIKTSIHYQISEKYGEGRHLLIANTAGIGVGKAKDTKKYKGVRHCSLEDFKTNNLTAVNIELRNLMSYLKPFFKETNKPQTKK
jgi:hypothetical protein